MAKISKEPYPSISEKERKTIFAKGGQGLRKHRQSGGFYTVKKTIKTKNQRIN
jgi:hypothetical protein